MPRPRLDPDFWNNTQPVPFCGCFLWTRGTISSGYGHLEVEGRLVLAHRRSWELTYGPIPKGLFVLHRCDTPSCVNPRHLFLGTAGDNARDMVAKGRIITPWKKKDSCRRGHPFDEKNTYIDADGCKNCRKCKLDWDKRNREAINRSARARYARDKKGKGWRVERCLTH